MPALPRRAWALAVLLGALMAAFTAAALSFLPEMVEEGLNQGTYIPWAIAVAMLAIPGYTCGFLSAVLSSASGRGDSVPTPIARNICFGLFSLLRWLACILTGPAYFAAGLFYYWLYCGDPGVLDVIILFELALLAVGYLVLQLACTAEAGSWLHANPWRVASLMQRLGVRAALAAGAATALVGVEAILGSQVAEKFHTDGWSGSCALGMCWISGMVAATVLFRWLSICCQRAKAAADA